MPTSIAVLVSCLSVVVVAVSEKPVQPEQVHLSLGSNAGEMVVTWITPGFDADTMDSLVEFRQPNGPISNVAAIHHTFNAAEKPNQEVRMLHVFLATMTGLVPGELYQYKVKHVSKREENVVMGETLLSFRAIDPSDPRIAFFGDVGTDEYPASEIGIGLLNHLAETDAVDMMIHLGDIGYNLQDDNGRQADAFLNAIQPAASSVPYQVIAGNHDEEGDGRYNQYRHRFNMMDKNGKVSNFYYSMKVGLIQFIFITSQFFINNHQDMMKIQLDWLKVELEEANRNRRERPWMIVGMHHPLYCTWGGKWEECCTVFRYKLFKRGSNLEQLFYEQGVDVIMAGHEHIHKTSYPLYRDTVCASLDCESNAYHNPRAPIHITTGVGGALDPELNVNNSFDAYSLATIGVSIIHSVTPTSMSVDFVDLEATVLESIQIVKTNAGANKGFSCPEAEEKGPINY